MASPNNKPENYETIELGKALQALATIAQTGEKQNMISTVDQACSQTLEVLREGNPKLLQSPALLKQIRFVLQFLEQCKAFRDPEFTLMVRQRVTEIQDGIEDLPQRQKAFEAAALQQAKEEAARKAAEAEAAKKAKAAAADKSKAEAKPEEPKEPAFQYQVAEKLCIQSIVRLFDSKLDVLRCTRLYGRHSTIETGIAPLFLYSLEFSVLIEDCIKAVIEDMRSTMTRVVYANTDPKADEEAIRVQLRECQRGLTDVVQSGLDSWDATMRTIWRERAANMGKSGGAATKKVEEKKGGLFGKLLGGKSKEPVKAAAPAQKKIQQCEIIHNQWMEANKSGRIYFPETFNFGVLKYLMKLEERIFIGEVDRVSQIAEQSAGRDDGAVNRALIATKKNSDQMFYEMALLSLFYTKSKVTLKDLQDAGMADKLDEGRLPLVVPELARMPMHFAARILEILTKKEAPRNLKICLDYYFESVLFLHLQIFGPKVNESAKFLNEKKDTLPKGLQDIVLGITQLIDRVLFSRQQARETGENITRNTKDTIDHTLAKLMSVYTAMHESANKAAS